MVLPQDFTPLVVTEVRPEADGVVSLALSRADGGPLPAWTPGAHLDVLLGEDLVRQYSLCSSPADGSWRIAVLREPASRGGSVWVHDRIRPGDVLRVGAPRNSFALDLSGQRHIFVAGGIGITPLLPMLAAAEAAGRNWTLLYLATSPARMAFTTALESYGDRVLLHCDSESGLLDVDSALDRLGASTATVHACGPAGLLTALEGYAERRPGCRLHVERFTADPARVPGGGDDRAFVVETGDGREIEVAADETILEAIQRAGLRALSSCREGVCGTCETAVLEGVPDHRDQLLTDEERAGGEVMMICVSRCSGDRIVLDL